MICRDCLHYDVCGGYTPSDLDKDIWHYCAQGKQDEIPDIEERCSSFKPKSRFIELPCAVGDTVYIVGIFTGQIVESRVEAITKSIDDITLHLENQVWVSVKQHLGKTVFLTKEEAVKALERSEGK